MSTQSKIDEIQKDGVYVNTNCDWERSGHSPIVVCRNKQNELNELYRALEQEQAVQRRLKEQEVAAKIKAEQEAAEARMLEAAEKRALEIEQWIQEEADQESIKEIHIEPDNAREEL
jgi:DNA-directed RNA polymerase specialized sigma subunit